MMDLGMASVAIHRWEGVGWDSCTETAPDFSGVGFIFGTFGWGQ